MQQFIQKIEQWAEDRNLIEGSTPQKQMLKLMEEFGELCGGIDKNKPEVIKDSIGNLFVRIMILNKLVRTGYYITDDDILPIIQHWDSESLLLEITNCLGEISYKLRYKSSGIFTYIKCIVCCLYYLSDKFELSFEDSIQLAYDKKLKTTMVR